MGRDESNITLGYQSLLFCKYLFFLNRELETFKENALNANQIYIWMYASNMHYTICVFTLYTLNIGPSAETYTLVFLCFFFTLTQLPHTQHLWYQLYGVFSPHHVTLCNPSKVYNLIQLYLEIASDSTRLVAQSRKTASPHFRCHANPDCSLCFWPSCILSHSVMSDSLWPHEWWPARLLCPWDYPCKNTRVGCHFLLWGIILT